MLNVLLVTSAQAVPSVSMIWRGVGATLVSPAASTDAIADIVLTTTTETVQGIFISIEFDANELQAVNATELAVVGLPGMTNSFSPISAGTMIDNGAGLVTLFDEATLSTGLVGGNTRTLGSITFHVVAAANDATDIDVIAALLNPGIDALTSPPNVTLCTSVTPGGCAFIGASITGPVAPPPMPEPTTALLLIAGIAGLGYVGRRSRS
ncbi:MAG: PEP-CTERM sorting domain-containing protein [Myxococcota bacterium]|nr:PEP-CTERM sorting domain-containing protein [Myxococcota bacterium]